MPYVKGTQHPAAKLTEEAVRRIRADYRPGWTTYQELAEEHGVSLQLIGRVVNGTAWTWVDQDN